MTQYYMFDTEGYYLEPIITNYNVENPQPDNVTNIRPPDGLYRAHFDHNTQAWEETGTPPEATPRPLSLEEQVQVLTAALLEMAGEIYG